MNSNYNNEFFDAYLRNECSEAERTAFKLELGSNSELRSDFEAYKNYRELLKAAPAVTASDDFTDRVVRDIRNRADARTFSWKKVYKGFFSKEFAGVVLSIVLIGALFWPQMTTMLEPTASYRLSEVEMAPEAPSMAMSDQIDEVLMEESAPTVSAAKDDALFGSNGVGADKAKEAASAGRSSDQRLAVKKQEKAGAKSKTISHKEMQRRLEAVEKKQVQSAPSTKQEADRVNELLSVQSVPAETAPAVVASHKSTVQQAPAVGGDMDGAKGVSVQAESKEMASNYSPRMEGSHEDRRLRSPRRAKKQQKPKEVQEEMVQESDMLFDQVEMESFSLGAIVESNDIAIVQDTVADTEPSSWRTFPFDHYKAMAISGQTDTVTVHLPPEELDRFVSAWKEKGGIVIDTVSQETETVLTVIPW